MDLKNRERSSRRGRRRSHNAIREGRSSERILVNERSVSIVDSDDRIERDLLKGGIFMKKSTKTLLKILLGVVLVMVIAVGIVGAKLYIGLEGSPFDRMKVKKSAREHLKENHVDTFYEIKSIDYDYKRIIYQIEVGYEGEDRVSFELEVDPDGKVIKSPYSEEGNKELIASGFTVEYYQELKEAFEKQDYPYNIKALSSYVRDDQSDPGEEHIIKIEDIELGKDYNIFEVGKEAGSVYLLLDHPDPTVENLEKMFIDTKSYLDKKGFGFYEMTLHVEGGPSPSEIKSIYASDITYDEIGSEGFLEKLKEVAS